jgi:hypothetical protein
MRGHGRLARPALLLRDREDDARHRAPAREKCDARRLLRRADRDKENRPAAPGWQKNGPGNDIPGPWSRKSGVYADRFAI